MINQLLAKGTIPDFAIRHGIRNLLKQRLLEEGGFPLPQLEVRKSQLINELKNSPIAIMTDKANDQHYMVPPKFFEYCLGKNLKYSCCYWDKAKNLDEAEDEMLEVTVARAEIKNGDRILELGHGWGAITLFMAKKFPASTIVAVSNSKDQGDFIRARAKERGLTNIEIITADMNNFQINREFDRIISIEMFEHMRNYKTLLEKINNWLSPEGKLFVHIFAHRQLTYKFEVKDNTDWMSQYFFSGGIMPCEHLFYYFQDHLLVEKHWAISGIHYAKTARAWLQNMDENKGPIMDILKEHYGLKEATKWFNYWRIFFMSCEELWNYKHGDEWIVGHYLFQKRK